MENIDEQLKISICSILNPVSEDTVTGIIEAIKYAGLESLSDLEFVEEEDLILVLKPVQRRKLIKAWSKQIVYPIEVPNNVSTQNCDLKEDSDILMLQLYSKHKNELFRSSLGELDAWSKIAGEIRAKTSLKCDKIQFLKRIVELKLKYEKWKTSDAASWTQEQLIYMTHAREAFETTKNTGKYHEMKQNLEEENTISPSEVSSVTSAASVSRITTTVPVANSTAAAITTHSSGSCDKKNLDDCEIVMEKNEWNENQVLLLLQIYTKHKAYFSCPNAKQSIWTKIASEVEEKSSLKCSESQCQSRIKLLKAEYKRIKNKEIRKRSTIVFLDKAKMAFEANEDTDNFFNQLSNSVELKSSVKRNREFCGRLLQMYVKYKEFSSPDMEEPKTWRKIAKKMRKKHSYDCGELLCRFDILRMRRQYQNLKTKKGAMTVDEISFYNETRKSFEIINNIGKH